MGIHLAITLFVCLPLGSRQEPPADTQPENVEEVVTTVEEAVAERLLKQHGEATRAGDSPGLVVVLRKMSAHDNASFAAPGLKSLGYRASKADKAAAKLEAEELGLKGKKELEAIENLRVSAVQAAAARLLGNQLGNKKVASALERLFRDKDLRKDRPEACAAVILSMGKLEVQKSEQDIFSLLKSNPQEDIARACVRYFGLIKTKDKSIVRTLCTELDAPAPADVNGGTNPPAGYWEQRWKTWNAIRRDVSWALKEITGQVFRPAEGDHPSDSRKALEYIKEHAKELGIR